MTRVVCIALLAFSSGARAAPISIALAPGAGEEARPKSEAEVLRELADAMRTVPSLALSKSTIRSTALREPDPIARAQAFGRELRVERALAVDLAPLGEGLVVYLHLVEVESGRELGSATVTLSDAARLPADDRVRLRGAAMRVLDPSRFVGRVRLRVDVGGALAVLDGEKVTLGGQPLELAVGTHALRVTHPAYHDFLRFIDVEFDRTLEIDVALAAYPISEGQMTEHRAAAALTDTPARKPPRVWRWWLLGASLVALAGGTIALVYFARPTVQADSIVSYRH